MFEVERPELRSIPDNIKTSPYYDAKMVEAQLEYMADVCRWNHQESHDRVLQVLWSQLQGKLEDLLDYADELVEETGGNVKALWGNKDEVENE